MLLKHMPEVEAMRFLHDVVDVCHLERKLKQRFPGDDEEVVKEVRLSLSFLSLSLSLSVYVFSCVCVFFVCVGAGCDAVMRMFMRKITWSLHTHTHPNRRYPICTNQWSALGLLSELFKQKGSTTSPY